MRKQNQQYLFNSKEIHIFANKRRKLWQKFIIYLVMTLLPT